MAKAKKKAPARGRRYFPIGRTITTMAGLYNQFEGAINELLQPGSLKNRFIRSSRKVMDGFTLENTAQTALVIGGGIVTGKALDHFKVNPRLRFGGKSGAKLF